MREAEVWPVENSPVTRTLEGRAWLRGGSQLPKLKEGYLVNQTCETRRIGVATDIAVPMGGDDVISARLISTNLLRSGRVQKRPGRASLRAVQPMRHKEKILVRPNQPWKRFVAACAGVKRKGCPFPIGPRPERGVRSEAMRWTSLPQGGPHRYEVRTGGGGW